MDFNVSHLKVRGQIHNASYYHSSIFIGWKSPSLVPGLLIAARISINSVIQTGVELTTVYTPRGSTHCFICGIKNGDNIFLQTYVATSMINNDRKMPTNLNEIRAAGQVVKN